MKILLNKYKSLLFIWLVKLKALFGIYLKDQNPSRHVVLEMLFTYAARVFKVDIEEIELYRTYTAVISKQVAVNNDAYYKLMEILECPLEDVGWKLLDNIISSGVISRERYYKRAEEDSEFATATGRIYSMNLNVIKQELHKTNVVKIRQKERSNA